MSIPAKLKVLIVGQTDFLEDNEQFIEFCKLFQVVHYDGPREVDALKAALRTEFNDISGIFGCFDGLWGVGDPNLFVEAFPESMKVYTYPWVGHDTLALDEFRAKGITICNVGSVSAPHVADAALELTLAAYKLTPFFQQRLRESCETHEARKFVGGASFDPVTGEPALPPKGKRSPHYTLGGKLLSSPQGHTVGIVGLGAIGKEIAKRLWAIGMNIHYTKRTPLTEEEAAKLPYEAKFYSSFTELVPECDLLVFAVPHSPTTRHFINAETIKLVKPGVRIVNIGRGSAINEEVLLAALEDGTVTSVGLDVFETEPKVDPRLAKRWDVVMTPHIGALSHDNLILGHEMNMKNIINILLENGPGISPIN